MSIEQVKVITSYGRAGEKDRKTAEQVINSVIRGMKWSNDELFVDTVVLEKV